MRTKLQAQSLPWAIFLMVIVSLLLTGIISQKSLYAKISGIQTNKVILIDDIYSGLQYALSSNESFIQDSILLNGPSYIKINKNPWGLFNCIEVNGKYNKVYNSSEHISGHAASSDNVANLVVKQARNRVSVTGNTKLKGKLWLPRAQLERSYIERKTYLNKELFWGNLYDAKNYKIKFSNQSLKSNITNLDKIVKNAISINLDDISDSIKNSFANETLIFENKSAIELSQTIIGNIIIKSDSLIIISEECNINNAIIYAPSVIINEGFIGKLQIFATDSIIINKDVSLNYPSVVCITNSKIKKPTIEIHENSIINGVIINADYSTKFKQSNIKIKTEAVINGFVYSDCFADIQGSVYGSLFCKKTLLSSSSSFYEDVFMDANIQAYDKCNKILIPIKSDYTTSEIILTTL